MERLVIMVQLFLQRGNVCWNLLSKKYRYVNITEKSSYDKDTMTALKTARKVS